MDFLVYWLARGFIAVIQSLPLVWVARLGRGGGRLAWWLDWRHRRVAVANLTQVFGAERTPAEIRALARENLLRIGETYLCTVRTARMSAAELAPHLEWRGKEQFERTDGRCGIIVIGHFGNFELFRQLAEEFPEIRLCATYRALRQPRLNELMQQLRNHPHGTFFERREGAGALKQELANGKSWLVLLADQHAGARGLWLPFLGRDCSCSASPAVFALRYHRPLITAICYRTGLARWRIEIGEWIPEGTNDHRRDVEDLTRDINAAYEAAIRRDPANWFWVHRRWKPASPFQERTNAQAASV